MGISHTLTVENCAPYNADVTLTYDIDGCEQSQKMSTLMLGQQETVTVASNATGLELTCRAVAGSRKVKSLPDPSDWGGPAYVALLTGTVTSPGIKLS